MRPLFFPYDFLHFWELCHLALELFLYRLFEVIIHSKYFESLDFLPGKLKVNFWCFSKMNVFLDSANSPESYHVDGHAALSEWLVTLQRHTLVKHLLTECMELVNYLLVMRGKQLLENVIEAWREWKKNVRLCLLFDFGLELKNKLLLYWWKCLFVIW